MHQGPPLTDLPWNAFTSLPFWAPVNSPPRGLRLLAHAFVFPNWILEDSCLLVYTQPSSSCANQRSPVEEVSAPATSALEWTYNLFHTSRVNTGTPRGCCSLDHFRAALIKRVVIFLLVEGVAFNLKKKNATPVKCNKPTGNRTGVCLYLCRGLRGNGNGLLKKRELWRDRTNSSTTGIRFINTITYSHHLCNISKTATLAWGSCTEAKCMEFGVKLT